MNTTLDRFTIGFGISASITIIFSTVLMILKEEFPALHTFMVILSGNHWTSHGLIDVILFIVLGFVLSKKNITVNIAMLSVISTIISVLGITLFVAFN